jgi:dienelactone hydrolase
MTTWTSRAALLLALAACADGVGGNPMSPVPSTERAGGAAVGAQDLDGSLDGAAYKIRVPAAWNGTLLVFAHGYRVRALYAGEKDDTHADAAYRGAELEDYLLGQGYAIAGSAYKTNGWAVADGIADSRALVDLFTQQIGPPKKTILWGFSLGSVVALTSAERIDGWDGFLAGCVVGAGTPRTFDRGLDFSLAYKVTFGWPASWHNTPGDLGGHADFLHDILPNLVVSVSGIKTDDRTLGLLEFIRLVNHGPHDGFYVPVIRDKYNYSTPALLFDMMYATEARAELELRAGGPVAENINHHYDLSLSDRLYLLGLGVDADELLERMNAETVYAPDPDARAYAKMWSEYTGRVTRPVMTLHNVGDGLTSVDGEQALAATYAAAGTSDHLVQTYVKGAGHCNFTPEQVGAALGMLSGWIDSGVRPDPDSLPTSLGFVPGFTPPAWPQPGLPDDDTE